MGFDLMSCFLLLCLAVSTVLAQTSSPTTSAPPLSATTQNLASIVPGSATYSYWGCYNETTLNSTVGNVRALAGGNMIASDLMTVEQCFALCGSDTFAGLEYGRECWCSNVLNSYAEKLSDANCSLTCSGDKKEVCGGPLMLTTYQRKANAKSGAVQSSTHLTCVLAALFLTAVLAV